MNSGDVIQGIVKNYYTLTSERANMRSKTIQLLNTFGDEDWRLFEKYLKSHSRVQSDIYILYKYLKQRRGKLTDSDIILQKAQKKHFPQITQKSFANVQSKLGLEIEKYLVQSRLFNDDMAFRLELLKVYTERGLYRIFDKKAEELEFDLYEQDSLDLFDSFNLLKIDHLRFFSDNPIKKEQGELLLTHLTQLSDQFNREYKTLLTIAKVHLKEVSKGKKKTKKISDPTSKLSKILNDLLLFKKNGGYKEFKRLHGFLFDKTQNLSIEMSSIILDILIHFGHQYIEKGDVEIVDELLQLYYFGFDQGLLMTNNKITENKFVNLITTICACGMFDDAHNTIKNYSNFLVSDIKESTIVLSLAVIDFYKGNHGKVIDRIRDYTFVSFSQNVRRRWLLLCCYFREMKDDADFVNSQVKNYNSYFYSNRSKLSESAYEGSINLSKVLTRLDGNLSSADLFKFVKTTNHLIFRTWLLKEIGAKATPIS